MKRAGMQSLDAGTIAALTEEGLLDLKDDMLTATPRGRLLLNA